MASATFSQQSRVSGFVDLQKVYSRLAKSFRPTYGIAPACAQRSTFTAKSLGKYHVLENIFGNPD
jgi:hypothetical protein